MERHFNAFPVGVDLLEPGLAGGEEVAVGTGGNCAGIAFRLSAEQAASDQQRQAIGAGGGETLNRGWPRLRCRFGRCNAARV